MNFRIALAVFLGLMIAGLAGVLFMNAGHLVFTLDDPYIHLALAENILRGHYGVNLGEFSAPSSSILWPFLLAPFSRLPGAEYVVLALNALAGAGTLWIAARILPPGKMGAWLLVLLIPATNMAGLAFTGMEHSLQVFLSAAILLGLIRESETGRLSGWTIAALVAAPLVRYECLALSLPALVFLHARGHRRPALWTGAAILILLAGFSGFLLSLGLEPLPTSVLAKSGVASSPGNPLRFAANLRAGLQTLQGALLGLALLMLLVRGLKERARARRGLAAVFAAATFLHLLAGQYTLRYELYLWTAALLVLFHLLREPLRRFFHETSFRKTALLSTLAIAVVCADYVEDTLTLPWASANIREQQYQMHRFVTEYYRRPAAVNDLGWVSWRNDVEVLDLWGLASLDALRAKRANPGRDTVWMASLTRARGVRLVLIYDDWFSGIPGAWGKVGELHRSPKPLNLSRGVVSFYALDCDAFREIRSMTRAFEKTLPRGTRFERAAEKPPRACAADHFDPIASR